MFKEIIHLLTSINDHLAAIRKTMDDSRKAELDGLAEALYPRLKKLSAWGH